MNDTEVLIINGSPGSGKSTLANAVAEKLRERNLAHAVIDVDELARIYPEHDMRSFTWKNLGSVWPNYAQLPHLKAILPVLIDTKEDLQALRDATPSEKFTICELIANDSVLKERVTQREPNEYWQKKLQRLVENYSSRDPQNKFGDFQVSTDDKSVDEAATEILRHLSWID